MTIRYLTAGETHGPQLTAILEGLPSNLVVDIEKIQFHLARRQKGYGRGRRMQIEQDQAQITGGLRHGKTTGAPLGITIENKDFTHWKTLMDPYLEQDEKRRIVRPRPGHADLVGGLKYQQRDLRNVLERASARETAIRVAVGAVARQVLEPFGIQIVSRVVSIGGIEDTDISKLSIEEIREKTEESSVRMTNDKITLEVEQYIDQIKAQGNSIGGIVECQIHGLPAGLGSHVQYDRKLEGRIAGAVMSIQAFKAVEFGAGFQVGSLKGSEVQDEIFYNEEHGFYRGSNRLGGFEGGMTNGMPILVRGAMKPIPTLYKPLQSVDIDTKEAFAAQLERSDCCAVPAACVVMEHVITFEVARAFLEKFGGDSWEEVTQNYKNYLSLLERY